MKTVTGKQKSLIIRPKFCCAITLFQLPAAFLSFFISDGGFKYPVKHKFFHEAIFATKIENFSF